MKLRSESDAPARPETPIPFMLPDTQAISISNGSSLLLCLPQELKDRIYHFVYRGFHINLPRYSDQSIKVLRITSLKLPSRVEDQLLLIASLTTCRQMYHEARNVLYSANTFEFSDPLATGRLLQRLSYGSYPNLAMRSIRLNVFVPNRRVERQWDNTFYDLAENFKNLRNLHIDVKESIWSNCSRRVRPHTPAFGKKPFLGGLLELKKLPLKTVEVVVHEHIWALGGRVFPIERVWTFDQKRAWAQSMQSAILGKD